MAVDAARVQKSGVYDVRVPLGTLREDLAQFDNMVQEAEANRRRIRLYSGLAMILGLVCAVAASIIGNNVLSFLSFLSFAGGVALFITSFVTGRDLHKHHDRFDLLKGISKALESDAHPSTKFAVKLHFKANPKAVREEKFDRRPNGKQKFFEEEFLWIAGELVDGTFLEESVTELKRVRSYTNPRGKSKSKTRLRYLLAVKLGYLADVYGDARQAQQSLKGDIRVPFTGRIKGVAVTDKAIAVKAIVGSEQEVPQASAMVCLGAYRILNSARKGAGK